MDKVSTRISRKQKANKARGVEEAPKSTAEETKKEEKVSEKAEAPKEKKAPKAKK